jgi:hypothetical protein
LESRDCLIFYKFSISMSWLRSSRLF